MKAIQVLCALKEEGESGAPWQLHEAILELERRLTALEQRQRPEGYQQRTSSPYDASVDHRKPQQ